MKAKLLFLLAAAMAASLFLSQWQAALAVDIRYRADVTPDAPLLQNVFSVQVQNGTQWRASGGELTLTTANQRGVWFGNHATWNTVPWQIADGHLGNFVSLRKR